LERAAAFIASVLLGVSPGLAQKAQKTTATSPVFQGLLVDAKGKTVGRVLGGNLVARQIRGAWVAVPAFVDGFEPVNVSKVTYYFQSTDCTGQSYFPVWELPQQGIVAVIPPAIEPSIYFPGLPLRVVTLNSVSTYGSACETGGAAFMTYAGPAQSVPVSSLGLTLPFSVK
jgi:hypothetical protein